MCIVNYYKHNKYNKKQADIKTILYYIAIKS